MANKDMQKAIEALQGADFTDTWGIPNQYDDTAGKVTVVINPDDGEFTWHGQLADLPHLLAGWGRMLTETPPQHPKEGR